MASGPITSWQIDGEMVETVTDFILGGSKITADGDNYVSGQTHAVGEPSACHTPEEVRPAVLKAHRRRGQGGGEAQDL